MPKATTSADCTLSLLHLPYVVSICIKHPHVEEVVEDLLVAYVARNPFTRHARTLPEMLVSTEHFVLVLLELFLLFLYLLYLLP